MTKSRIMIVEDESIVALDIQQRLQRMGYEIVAVAARAETAIQRAQEVLPDLVLMDIQLRGELDGIDAADLIYGRFNIPVIFLTAFADEATLQRAKKVTPYGYLLKPLQEQELHTTIATALYRHQIEQKLKESERWLHTTLHSIGDGIIATNTDGFIQFMNPVAAKLTGWEPKEALGKNVRSVFQVERRKREPLLTQETGMEMEPAHQMYLYHKDGRLTPVEQTTTSIKDENGRFLGVVIIFRDISERLYLEQTIRSYTFELHARNEELDAFAHTAAHDLQTPLTPIVGLAEMLEMNLANMDLDEALMYIRAIRKSGRKLLNVVEELITLSQVRKVDVQTTPIDMGRIVQDALERLEHMIDEYSAHVQLPAVWPAVMGYGPWIEEVWVNYVSNAIKYGGDPPQLILGADVQPNDQVRFWIRDNGYGLAPEQQAQLFTPFTQLHQASTNGTGLGLSIVRRIVEKLGGQVQLESVVGQGSVFSFTLPHVQAQQSSIISPA
ncbi:MAG: PAS domain S-box protein [Chloroflexota bacterium]|nr:PAS domain S-box protein [Anaerolineales bacterium]